MKIAACIVVFKPNYDRLNKNIEAIVWQVDLLILVCNSELDIEIISNYSDIIVIQNNKNLGIAFALNQAIDFGFENDIEWILTLDQDSVVPSNMISTYLSVLPCTDKAAILCPRLKDIKYCINGYITENVENTQVCITSGSLTNIAAVKRIDGFDNALFIDEVDHDLCARLIEAGYKIYRCNEVVLSHALGDSVFHKFLGKKIVSTNHSPIRYYYMSRNIIYLTAKKQRTMYRSLYLILRHSIIILLYESRKSMKLLNILKGMVAGLTLRRKYIRSHDHRNTIC